MSVLIFLLMQTFLAKGLGLSSLHVSLVGFSFLTTYHVVDAVVGPISVEIPLDHFNHSDKRTFQNRYWMNDTYYEKGGPIFMYDNGELGIPNSTANGLLDGSEVFFSPLELAKKYKGIVLEWEHRFFGGSMPFDYNATTGVAIAEYDAYKYLTDDQALEDVVYFAKHFQPPGHENDTLTSYSTPWIWIGASYAGYRAAMIRLRNPDVIFASWSSSGPVETAVDASVYYNQIQQNIPSNCSAEVHAAITYADDILTDGSEEDAALIKRAIFLSNTLNPKGDQIYAGTLEDISYWDIANILSYPFQAAFLSFQSFGYRIALEKFCTQLEIYNPSNSTPFTITSPASVLFNNSLNLPPTSSGIAATFSPKDAFYSYLYAVIQKSLDDYAFFPGNPRDPPDIASWTWMLCNQNCQWQVSQYPAPKNLITRFYNISSTEANYCHAVFPYAPPLPKVKTLLKYGGWNMKPSNVMFTNGGIDPWRTMSIQSTTDINPQAPNRPSTTVVPPCNVPPPGDEVYGVVYPGEGHGSDISRQLGNVTGSADVGLELFGNALDVWLPCFKAKDPPKH